MKTFLLWIFIALAGIGILAFSILPSKGTPVIIFDVKSDPATNDLVSFLSDNGTSGALLVSKSLDEVTELYWTWNGRTINGQTFFNLGSLSKQFTGFLVLQLEVEGKISVKQIVSEFIEETHGSVLGSLKIIDLLQMTSGLPKDEFLLTKGLTQLLNKKWNSREIVNEVSQYPLEFESGTRFQYSNLGYILLGQIISRVEKKPLEVILKEKIFKPFGMSETFLDIDEPRNKNLSMGHLLMLRKWLPMPNWNYSFLQGAGGIVSNVRDLQKWLLGLSKFFFQNESLRLVYLGKESPFQYAYGWSFFEEVASHSGESPGFCSYVATLPTFDTFVVITLNSDFCMKSELRDQMSKLAKTILKKK